MAAVLVLECHAETSDKQPLVWPAVIALSNLPIPPHHTSRAGLDMAIRYRNCEEVQENISQNSNWKLRRIISAPALPNASLCPRPVHNLKIVGGTSHAGSKPLQKPNSSNPRPRSPSRFGRGKQGQNKASTWKWCNKNKRVEGDKISIFSQHCENQSAIKVFNLAGEKDADNGSPLWNSQL